MGLFNRNKPKQEEIIIENRDAEPKEQYTVPTGLEFLTAFISKGEATAVSAFFSGVQLISSTIASTSLSSLADLFPFSFWLFIFSSSLISFDENSVYL